MPENVVHLTSQQLSWLAGLLEGEGAFTAGVPSMPRQPQVKLGMTDEDTVQRAAELLGVGVNKYQLKKGLAKPMYCSILSGGAAVSLMSLLRPLMSARRKQQIDRAVACYNPRIRYPYRKFCVIDGGKSNDRHWLAGYLEGEGCFVLHRNVVKLRTYINPEVIAVSTDSDTIEQVRQIWCDSYSIKVSVSHSQRRETFKIAYRVAVRGNKALMIMRDLYPLFGQRRQRRIREIAGESI
jgi:hypothetical protein